MTLRSRLIPSRCTRPIVPAKYSGHTASAPCVAAVSAKAPAIRSSASSHGMRANCVEPLGPTRRSGCVRRSGWWMRSA